MIFVCILLSFNIFLSMLHKIVSIILLFSNKTLWLAIMLLGWGWCICTWKLLFFTVLKYRSFFFLSFLWKSTSVKYKTLKRSQLTSKGSKLSNSDSRGSNGKSLIMGAFGIWKTIFESIYAAVYFRPLPVTATQWIANHRSLSPRGSQTVSYRRMLWIVCTPTDDGTWLFFPFVGCGRHNCSHVGFSRWDRARVSFMGYNRSMRSYCVWDWGTILI